MVLAHGFEGPVQDGSGEMPSGVLGHWTVVAQPVMAEHCRGTAVRQGELEEGRNPNAVSPGLSGDERLSARVSCVTPVSFFSGREPG